MPTAPPRLVDDFRRPAGARIGRSRDLEPVLQVFVVRDREVLARGPRHGEGSVQPGDAFVVDGDLGLPVAVVDGRIRDPQRRVGDVVVRDPERARGGVVAETAVQAHAAAGVDRSAREAADRRRGPGEAQVGARGVIVRRRRSSRRSARSTRTAPRCSSRSRVRARSTWHRRSVAARELQVRAAQLVVGDVNRSRGADRGRGVPAVSSRAGHGVAVPRRRPNPSRPRSAGRRPPPPGRRPPPGCRRRRSRRAARRRSAIPVEEPGRPRDAAVGGPGQLQPGVRLVPVGDQEGVRSAGERRRRARCTSTGPRRLPSRSPWAR